MNMNDFRSKSIDDTIEPPLAVTIDDAQSCADSFTPRSNSRLRRRNNNMVVCTAQQLGFVSNDPVLAGGVARQIPRMNDENPHGS
jgi:hypothetical protein